MFKKILIANRGEIACRIIRTAKKMGIATVAVYSDADATAAHVRQANEALRLGPAPASESYLRADLIIQAAIDSGAEAIHPGYGFLSENAEFVDGVVNAGLVFIGPTATAIRAMGLKDAAKELMQSAGVPIVPGYHGNEQDPDKLHAIADHIGYPLLIKARAGGGGKGMRLVNQSNEFLAALNNAMREGENAFGDPAVLLEKYIATARHIEVQVFGDEHGNHVHMFERDCSLQRRHQKVIEEAPAPGISDIVRAAMTDAALAAAKAINYTNAGTIEFIVDATQEPRRDGFWFMEMNTRLQVEHPVTEAITGLDLVEWQLRVAAGEPLPLSQNQIAINGCSMEARVYAEDVAAGFLPASGIVQHVAFDPDARLDSAVETGSEITPFYDPMIAKVIVAAQDRSTALEKLRGALGNTHIAGVRTNVAFLIALCGNRDMQFERMSTALIENSIDALTETKNESATDQLLSIVLLANLHNRSNINGVEPGWRLWGDCALRCTVTTDSACHSHTALLLPNRVFKLQPNDNPNRKEAEIRLVDVTATTLSSELRAMERAWRSVSVHHASGSDAAVHSHRSAKSRTGKQYQR